MLSALASVMECIVFGRKERCFEGGDCDEGAKELV